MKWTQAAVAQVLGVAQQTVNDWLQEESSTITGSGNGLRPDARKKLNDQEKEEAYERIQAGESQDGLFHLLPKAAILAGRQIHWRLTRLVRMTAPRRRDVLRPSNNPLISHSPYTRLRL